MSDDNQKGGNATGEKAGVRPVMRGLLGGYCLLILLFLLYLIVALLAEPANGGSVSLFGCAVGLEAEARVLVLVALVGALGACIHAATSFVTFVGLAQLGATWIWWYVLRPPIGAALGIVLYFILRVILFSGSASLQDSACAGSWRFLGSSGCSPSRRSSGCGASSTRCLAA